MGPNQLTLQVFLLCPDHSYSLTPSPNSSTRLSNLSLMVGYGSHIFRFKGSLRLVIWLSDRACGNVGMAFVQCPVYNGWKQVHVWADHQIFKLLSTKKELPSSLQKKEWICLEFNQSRSYYRHNGTHRTNSVFKILKTILFVLLFLLLLLLKGGIERHVPKSKRHLTANSDYQTLHSQWS